MLNVTARLLLLLLFAFCVCFAKAKFMVTEPLSFANELPEEFSTYSICSPVGHGMNETFHLKSKSFVRVNKTICEEKDTEFAKVLFGGKIVLQNHIMEACEKGRNFGQTQPDEINFAYSVGTRVGLAAIINFYDSGLYEIPNIGYIEMGTVGAGLGTDLPYVVCGFSEHIFNYGMPPQFMDKLFFNGTYKDDLKVDLFVDENPWVSVLHSWYYFIIMRGLGVAYMVLGTKSFFWGRILYRAGASKIIAATLLFIEAVALNLVGIFLLAGGWFSNWAFPAVLHPMMPSLLVGCSLATSLLAGFYFAFFRKQVSNMKSASGTLFWKTNRVKMISFISVLVAMDIITAACTILVIPGYEMIVGGITGLAQLIVGLLYVSMTFGFLRQSLKAVSSRNKQSVGSSRTSGRAGGGGRSKIEQQLMNKARYLFLSAVCMFFNVCPVSVLVATSAALYYGIWSPSGWAFIWTVHHFVRFLTSMFQIFMCKPSSDGKKKAKANAQAKFTSSNGTKMSTNGTRGSGGSGSGDSAESTLGSSSVIASSEFEFGDDVVRSYEASGNAYSRDTSGAGSATSVHNKPGSSQSAGSL